MLLAGMCFGTGIRLSNFLRTMSFSLEKLPIVQLNSGIVVYVFHVVCIAYLYKLFEAKMLLCKSKAKTLPGGYEAKKLLGR